MKLIQLTATFGCLDHETLTFEEGLTVIHSPNGQGKSTWCAFLRTMLYGLDTRQRDRKGVPADKNRYRPWNGAAMEGLLVCQYQGEIIEIKRTSAGGVPMGEFSARVQETGLPVLGMTADNAGELLTGLTREVFDRSVFLRQSGLAVTQSQELDRRLSALVSTGEEETSWAEADGQLKAWQRRRRYHQTGRIPQLEEEAAALRETQNQTAALRRELAQLQSRVTSLTKQKAQWEERLANENREEAAALHRRKEEAAQELAAAQEEVRAIQDQEDGILPPDLAEEMDDLREELRGRKRLMTGLVVLMVLLTIVAAGLYLLPVFVPSWPLAVPAVPWLFVAGAGILLWLLVLVAALGKAVGDRRAKKKLRKLQAQAETHPRRTMEEALIQRDRAKRYYDALVQQEGGRALPPEAEACQESLHAAQRELAQVQGQLSALGDPVLVDAQLDQVQETLAAQQEDYDALDIALEALQEADEQIHARLSPQLSRQAGEYFSRLTQGRYTGVGLTRDLAVTVREGTDLADQPLSYLSQGTVDQLYLALRLALAQVVLPAGADCPMVLDDALVTFDDTRLALALRLLQDLSRSRQVLLFTCQSREGQMLEGQPGVTIQERG